LLGRHERGAAGRLAAVVLGLLALAAGETAAAADTLSVDEKEEFNYAFATEVGSGVYEISGRTLQVYRLPLSYTFRTTEDTRRGWRLTFPLTFGFFNFNAEDIIDNGLRENVATVSLVPGVDFLIPVTRNWVLTPHAEAGYVWDRSGDADAAVYSTGVRSRADFAAGLFDLGLGNGLTYSLVDPKSTSGLDSMVIFETALDASHLLSGDGTNRADYDLYFVNRLYFTDSEHPFPVSGGTRVLSQYEVGVTFGSRDGLKVWKIPLPRVGIGYLFGNDLSVIRLVLGLPAQSLKR
jgi:hypothetical protein